MPSGDQRIILYVKEKENHGVLWFVLSSGRGNVYPIEMEDQESCVFIISQFVVM